jgi:hypothetical protein
LGEIAQASRAQTEDLAQINTAVSSLDQMTQQNAALVEQAAAASEAMQEQAAKLSQAVSVFKLDAHAGRGAMLTSAPLLQTRLGYRGEATQA